MSRLIFVGAMHIDEIATVRGKLVMEASNPVQWQRYVGGVSCNAARAAQAHLSIHAKANSVKFHTAVGDDSDRDALLERMIDEGVHIEPHLIEEHTTGRYSVIVDETGQLVLGLADVQLCEQLQAKPIIESALDPSLIDTLIVDANLSSACLGALIETASSLPITITALTVSPAKAKRLLPWASKIDLLFCNRREALSLAIEHSLVPADTQAEQLSLKQLADDLVEIGFNDMVLSDASSALLVRYQGNFTSIPTPPVKITHNVNGAGDALAGASIAALSTGVSLEEAVSRFGLPLAADVLEGRRAPLPL